MPLQPRLKHDLCRELARIIWQDQDIKKYCDDTIGFNQANIRYQGSAKEMWTNIITEAEKQTLLLQLLDVIRDKINNEQLNTQYIEISQGIERRLEVIARAIKNDDCVLFIGPELLQCNNGNSNESFNQLFSSQIVQRLENAGLYYDRELKNTLSYIADRFEDLPNRKLRELGDEAKNSFTAVRVYRPFFQKIARLKFPLVISANPDDMLEQELTRAGIPFSSGFYDRSNKEAKQVNLDDNVTMVYKIFGSFENPYSILYTDNDRVQFAKNVIMDDPQVPQEIHYALREKLYLFLGFNFQEWHLKILIDCLKLTKNEDRSFALLLEEITQSNIEYFEKSHKFYFINQNIEAFLDDIIARTA